MTTIYRHKPNLVNRMALAELAVVAMIEKAIRAEIRVTDAPARVETTFRLRIERCLKGKAARSTVSLRLIGGASQGIRTPWMTRIKPGERWVLMMARDVGPRRRAGEYVPVFNGFYAVDHRERITVEVEAVGLLRKRGIPVRLRRLTIKHLTRLVEGTDPA